MSVRHRTLRVEVESYPLATPFRITGYTMTTTDVIVVTVVEEGVAGRGEASGIYYRAGDDVAGMLAGVEQARAAVEAGAGREELQELLPAGGARNALDCALWDLEAGLSGIPVWKAAGLDSFKPLTTTWTLSADTPERMAAKARHFEVAKALKLKLLGDGQDAARVAEVRAARPGVWLGVDANQGLDPAQLAGLAPALRAAGVALIEQPFKAGQEHLLDDVRLRIPLAVDESVQVLADLDRVAGRAEVVNVKLDKCGGLTHALRIARGAAALGMRVMVGNTIGSSLAMAPAMVFGQSCEVVDLDGPILLARDWKPAVSYADGRIHCPAGLWGGDATAGCA